jgi:hypothetical protein
MDVGFGLGVSFTILEVGGNSNRCGYGNWGNGGWDMVDRGHGDGISVSSSIPGGSKLGLGSLNLRGVGDVELGQGLGGAGQSSEYQEALHF